MSAPDAEAVTARFLAAVEARDASAAGACFAEDGTYANVPHPPAVGPSGVRDMLAPVLERSERVRWEIVTAAYAPRRAWLERLDRFVIDGQEYAVACNGVLETDDRGLVTAFRDYVDLGPWRERIGPALR